MNKLIVGGIALVVVAIAGFGFYTRSTTETQTQTQTQPETQVVANTKTYTLADVQSHKDATSCWTTISGKVYDVTSWVAKHPGGKKAILSTCGVDATNQFSGKHGGQQRPESELAKYLIGDLAN